MKLRSHLILLVIAAILPALIFVGVTLIIFSHQQRAALEEGLINTARALSLAVDREIEATIRVLQALATSEHLDSGDLRKFYQEAKRVLDARQGWYNMLLVDPSGQQLVNMRQPFGSPLPRSGAPEVVRQVSETGQPVISNLFWGHLAQAHLVGVDVPVIRDGRVRYVLTTSTYPTFLVKLLKEQNIPADWLATIIDRNQIIIARTRNLEEFLGKASMPLFGAKSKEAEEGSFRGASHEGEEVYAGFRRSELSGWTVGLAAPVSTVATHLRRLLITVTLAGLTLLLLGVALATLLGRRIANPIIALSASAAALGRGETPQSQLSSVLELNQVGREIEIAAAKRKQMEEEFRNRYREGEILRDVGQQVLASPDMRTVVDGILDKAISAGRFDLGAIRLIEPGERMLKPVASRGYRNEELIRGHSVESGDPTAGNLQSRAFSSGAVSVLENVSDAPGLRTLKSEGVQSAILVPVQAPDQVLGTILLASRTRRTFPPSLVHLLESIGNQLGIAVQKASLLEQTQRNLERVSALYSIQEATGSTLDLKSLLDIFLERITLSLPYPICPTVRLLNKESGELEPMACRNVDEQEWRTHIRQPSHARKALEAMTPTMIRNVQTDPQTRYPDFARKHGFCSYIGIPLIYKNETLGVFAIYTKSEHDFSREEIQFLSALAGQAAGAIHNARLYDDLKVKHLELARAGKVKDEFLSVISHELRTPLNVVVGYAGMIKDGLLGSVSLQQQEALGKIINRADDQLSMISNILYATALEAEKIKMETHEVSLGDFMEQLRSGYEVSLNKKLALEWDWASDLPPIRTDSAKLKHVLQNLIDNAIKFTERGSVTVSAKLTGVGDQGTGAGAGPRPPAAELHRRGQELGVSPAPQSPTAVPQFVEFKVADTGIGIPRDQLPHIFEKFRQVDSSETRLFGGVGMGLHIAMNFTELLGGTIEVESEPGKGTTFTVKIPCAN